MDNNEYRTRLEILLDFFRCASANKNIKTITVENTGFLDDAELIIDLIEKKLEKRPKGRWKRITPNVLKCTNCKKNVCDVSTYMVMNYCPNCGVHMKTVEK